MIRKTSLWALRALLHLAGVPAGRLALAAEVAGAIGAPLGTTAKVLQRLSLAGMVVSVRGARGGYLLAEPPTAIGVLRVLQAMRDPLAGPAVAPSAFPRLDDLLTYVHLLATERFRQLTIADLAAGGGEGQAT